MKQIVIDKNRDVVLLEKFKYLQKKTVLKAKQEKTMTLEEARSYSKKLIQQWAAFE